MSAEMLMIVFFLKRRGRDLTFCSMVTVHTSCTALVILSAAKDLLPSAAALCIYHLQRLYVKDPSLTLRMTPQLPQKQAILCGSVSSNAAWIIQE